MRRSVSNEESKVDKKNKHRLFWIIFGTIIAVLAAAAFCIPFGINLARRNVDTTTTATSTVATPTTTTLGGKQSFLYL